MPDKLVMAVLADRLALAPTPVAVKLTVTLAIGLLFVSRTVTCSGSGNGVPTPVLCVAPPVAVMEPSVGHCTVTVFGPFIVMTEPFATVVGPLGGENGELRG